MKLAFLFPGQGSQKISMLHSLPDHSAVGEVLQEASDVIGENIYNLDTAEALTSTVSVQLSLLIASVAVSKAFEAEGVRPDFVAGHSVGAFGAAVTCGAMDFADALKIVKLRGVLMEQAFPSGYGMGVISGLDAKSVCDMVEAIFSEENPVYSSNINAADQITISGSIPGINKVLDQASQGGARTAELLNVSVPSHCPLLNSVGDSLYDKLAHINIRSPVVLYASNRKARLIRNSEQIREDLAFNVSHPVRWYEISSLLCEYGTRLLIEMPSGNVLTNLNKKTLPGARSVSVDENGFENCFFLAKRFCS
ncbi:malonate decarboxylase subunit epsilon [Cytobacillus oceanisediminis]|uniref:malonate decarboxylase subunit epsilon n=1 Tax=Cytobacillus oceanisediminis TaxID=665099 RepID=UPI003735B91C